MLPRRTGVLRGTQSALLATLCACQTVVDHGTGGDGDPPLVSGSTAALPEASVTSGAETDADATTRGETTRGETTRGEHSLIVEPEEFALTINARLLLLVEASLRTNAGSGAAPWSLLRDALSQSPITEYTQLSPLLKVLKGCPTTPGFEVALNGDWQDVADALPQADAVFEGPVSLAGGLEHALVYLQNTDAAATTKLVPPTGIVLVIAGQDECDEHSSELESLLSQAVEAGSRIQVVALPGADSPWLESLGDLGVQVTQVPTDEPAKLSEVITRIAHDLMSCTAQFSAPLREAEWLELSIEERDYPWVPSANTCDELSQTAPPDSFVLDNRTRQQVSLCGAACEHFRRYGRAFMVKHTLPNGAPAR